MLSIAEYSCYFSPRSMPDHKHSLLYPIQFLHRRADSHVLHPISTISSVARPLRNRCKGKLLRESATLADASMFQCTYFPFLWKVTLLFSLRTPWFSVATSRQKFSKAQITIRDSICLLALLLLHKFPGTTIWSCSVTEVACSECCYRQSPGNWPLDQVMFQLANYFSVPFIST